MRVLQLRFQTATGWQDVASTSSNGSAASQSDERAQLVLAFGTGSLLERPDVLQTLRHRFPEARVVTCSTGGEIAGDDVLDDSVVATAITFDAATVEAAEATLTDAAASEDVGRKLAESLPADGLRHVLVFAEGLAINGSALAAGMNSALPGGVAVTGGLAADGDRFARTGVGLDKAPTPGRVVALGLYGDGLKVGMGSLGGWDTFGPEYTVTKSKGNVLYELNGQPALELYKRYLGPRSYALPASGLLFPLHVREDASDSGVVRTLLGIDEQTQSITFAGDIPEGRTVRLMQANLDRLIDAAGQAAGNSASKMNGTAPAFVLLVSCIGRKLLLQRRTNEEVRSARRIFGPDPVFAGFYSYGEISPLTPEARCTLHNQTMTITTLAEASSR